MRAGLENRIRPSSVQEKGTYPAALARKTGAPPVAVNLTRESPCRTPSHAPSGEKAKNDPVLLTGVAFSWSNRRRLICHPESFVVSWIAITWPSREIAVCRKNALNGTFDGMNTRVTGAAGIAGGRDRVAHQPSVGR